MRFWYLNNGLIRFEYRVSQFKNGASQNPFYAGIYFSQWIDSVLINAWARICKRLWSPGIDSKESIPPAYVAWRAGTTNRVFLPARQVGNRFLGSFKGLQIRALGSLKVKKIRVLGCAGASTKDHMAAWGRAGHLPRPGEAQPGRPRRSLPRRTSRAAGQRYR